MTQEELIDLLARKFPKVDGFSCDFSFPHRDVSITFKNCLVDQSPSITELLIAFMGQDDFKIAPTEYRFDYDRVQPSLVVKMSMDNCKKLFDGLSLSENIPPVSSTRRDVRMRC